MKVKIGWQRRRGYLNHKIERSISIAKEHWLAKIASEIGANLDDAGEREACEYLLNQKLSELKIVFPAK